MPRPLAIWTNVHDNGWVANAVENPDVCGLGRAFEFFAALPITTADSALASIRPKPIDAWAFFSGASI